MVSAVPNKNSNIYIVPPQYASDSTDLWISHTGNPGWVSNTGTSIYPSSTSNTFHWYPNGDTIYYNILQSLQNAPLPVRSQINKILVNIFCTDKEKIDAILERKKLLPLLLGLDDGLDNLIKEKLSEDGKNG